MPKHISIETDSSHAGERADGFLARMLPDYSRSRLQSLMEEGLVLIDQKPLRAAYRLKGGEKIDVEIPPPRPSLLAAQEIDVAVLYEDDDLIVINKAAGLVVHPGAGNPDGTLVNALLHRYPGLSVGDSERPGLVHRLDKETSGVMVCARNDKAHRALTESFKSRDVTKIYRAFCVGEFHEKHFELVTGHRRHMTDRKRFTTKLRPPPPKEPDSGRSSVRLAHSKFTVLRAAQGVSELQVEILTGRTHQIRAHLADVHHPLLHDSLYGGVKAMQKLVPSPVRDVAMALTRHALHAERLAFAHPSTGEPMEFEAPLPEDLLVLHRTLGA